MCAKNSCWRLVALAAFTLVWFFAQFFGFNAQWAPAWWLASVWLGLILAVLNLAFYAVEVYKRHQAKKLTPGQVGYVFLYVLIDLAIVAFFLAFLFVDTLMKLPPVTG
ncbi:hypothetical protein BK816_07945 [Boudabousia tangfeifanii]|uniref:Uncharacterized protein n=1 Tax=Boudabousia tangfeifanii TaxID=1912795 RepID=A0A1D9MLQ4_9ACTO|nr:ATP synthase subunit I [Boudabousia tangfeifanii]AOZ73226.1 hypothetical protein BK816_07945 [Boudabousia tangfeifanii]